MCPHNKEVLLEKIRDRSMRLAVLGSGYVGLPTATLFANADFHVTAVDVNSFIVDRINEGISPIKENGLTELLSLTIKKGTLDADLLSNIRIDDFNVIIITVQTPINEEKEPDLSFLMSALNVISMRLKQGMLVVVCSTIPPGTMNMIKVFFESKCRLTAEEDFFLAYVPERIAPGNALKELVKNARIVGGIGKDSTELAVELFSVFCENLLPSDSGVAEIAKLAENTFRDINIAFANQLALLCDEHKVSIKKVIKLANTHPRVNIHLPGPGVGGPCLTKDPYLLIYGSRTEGPNLIATARKLNDSMPVNIVNLAVNALSCEGKKDIKQAHVTVLGTAYKADVDDPRGSPSELIIHRLLDLGLKVSVYDPLCTATFGGNRSLSIADSLHDSDCLILITDHSEFKDISLTEIKQLMNQDPIIVDGKLFFDAHEAERLGFKYCAIG